MSLTEKILMESEWYGGDFVLYHGSNVQFDKFDLSFVKSGNGLNKYGRGIYLTSDYDTAVHYALDGSRVGYVYTVKAYNLKTYHDFEDFVEEGLINFISRKLMKMGNEDDAELMVQEFQESDGQWSFKMLYDYLAAVVQNEEIINEWLLIYGISGLVAKEASHQGLVYVAFDDDELKILDCEEIKRR